VRFKFFDGEPMSPQRLVSLVACIAASIPVSALAHDGPRVWVSADDGQIVTKTSDDDFDPTTYMPAQVFTAELSPYFGTYTTQFPGYESPRDDSGAVGDGTWFGFKIAGPLLTPNADSTHLIATSQRFAAAAPQLAITFPDVPPAQQAAYTRYTAAGVVAGYDFTNTITEHTHLAYTLLGDGTSAAAAGPDGVYVLPMVLTSPSLATSKWFFLTFKKGTTDAATLQAAALAHGMADVRPGDTNFDGSVDFADLVTLAQNYNQNQPAGQWWATGDFNFDGAVGFDDLVPLAQNYGHPASFAIDWTRAQSLVPEPASLSVLTASLAAASRRRRPKRPGAR
jgi:hypothetical protein